MYWQKRDFCQYIWQMFQRATKKIAKYIGKNRVFATMFGKFLFFSRSLFKDLVVKKSELVRMCNLK